MKKLKKLFTVLLLLGACCAVFAGVIAFSGGRMPEPSPTPTASPVPTSTPTPVPTPTPEPTPTPIPTLDTETGVLFDRFDSELTGNFYEYCLIVPENAVENMPLIVFLHGDGLIGNKDGLAECGIVRAAKEIYGDALPFLLLMPSAREATWTDYNYPATLKDLIDRTAEDYHADTEKIIITGHSRGAIGVWTMVDRYPGYFSAAVPVSCPSIGYDPHSFLETPVRAFVGDGCSDYGHYGQDMDNIVYNLRYFGVDAELTVLENCEHGQSEYNAYSEATFRWMLEQGSA